MLKGTLAPKIFVRILCILVITTTVFAIWKTDNGVKRDKTELPLLLYTTKVYGSKTTGAYITNIQGTYHKRIWTIETLSTMKAAWSPSNRYIFLYSNFRPEGAIVAFYDIPNDHLESFLIEGVVININLSDLGYVAIETVNKMFLYDANTNALFDITSNGGKYFSSTWSTNGRYLAFFQREWAEDRFFKRALVYDAFSQELIVVSNSVTFFYPLKWRSSFVLEYVNNSSELGYANMSYSLPGKIKTQVSDYYQPTTPGERAFDISHPNTDFWSDTWLSEDYMLQVRYRPIVRTSKNGIRDVKYFVDVYVNREFIRTIDHAIAASWQN